MRLIQRTAARAPTLFSPEGSGRRKAHANEERFRDGEFRVDRKGSNNLSFPEHWNRPDVRGALYAQQGKVCAYCGHSLPPRSDRGDAEHFRPKKKTHGDLDHGGYWWVAYEFTNYVLSCRACNSSRKRNKFPLRARAKRVTFPDRHRLRNEARLFLDPASDPVEKLLRVEWRAQSCPVRPARNATPTQRKQAQAMIECFRLNKEPELVRQRREVAEEAFRLLNAGKPQEAGELAIRYRPHSLVARQVLLDRNAKQHLPSASAEFNWLLRDLVRDLKETLDRLADHPGDDILRHQADELLWSLAVLVAAPPAGAPANLAHRLDRLGLTTMVAERVSQLI